MLLNRKNMFIFFIGIFILMFINSVAFAEGIVPCNGLDCQLNDLKILFQNTINVVFPIINAVAVVLMIWGGIRMVTAGDDANKFKTGKTILMAVAVGILIIYGAKFLISSFVHGLGIGDQFEQKTEEIYNK